MERRHWWSTRGALAAALLSWGAHARAQAPACPACSKDTVPHLHLHPGLGLRFGTPARASAAIGMVAGTERRDRMRTHGTELAIIAEPGWSAGRASLGVLRSWGNLGTGVGVNATVLRTWKDPLGGLRDNQTYVGGEVWGWPVFFMGPRLGLFRSVRGSPRTGWYVTGDFGFGL